MQNLTISVELWREPDNTEETLLKEKTKAYLAGLIDGDGCLTIVKQRTPIQMHYRPIIVVTNNYRPLMRWLVHHFGGSFCKRAAHGRRQTSYRWYVTAQPHICRVLSLIRPYLRLKSEQAAVLSAFCSISAQRVPEQREKLYREIRRLIRKRSVTTDMRDFSKPNLANAYLAGCFDAEGSVEQTLRRQIKISLGNTEWRLPKFFKRVYGGNCYPTKPEPNRRPFLVWYLGAAEWQERCLLRLLPYLVIKRDAAKLALNFIREKDTVSSLGRPRVCFCENTESH